jgi:nucleotide-binding universal stress UspA family protein
MSLRPQSRTLIVAIDGLTREGLKGNPVVHWTLRNHARKGDKLVFIHATKHLDAQTAQKAGYTKDVSPGQVTEMERNLSEVLMDILSAYGSELASLEIEVKIEKGDPREVLTKSVDAYKADFIVVGSRGVGAVKR